MPSGIGGWPYSGAKCNCLSMAWARSTVSVARRPVEHSTLFRPWRRFAIKLESHPTALRCTCWRERMPTRASPAWAASVLVMPVVASSDSVARNLMNGFRRPSPLWLRRANAGQRSTPIWKPMTNTGYAIPIRFTLDSSHAMMQVPRDRPINSRLLTPSKAATAIRLAPPHVARANWPDVDRHTRPFVSEATAGTQSQQPPPGRRTPSGRAVHSIP